MFSPPEATKNLNVIENRTITISAFFLSFLFVLSACAVLPAGAVTRGPVSYNIAPYNREHAPISGMGLAGLAHGPFVPGTSGTGTLTATRGGALSDLTPSGSIRFINDSSYILDSETSVAVDPGNAGHIVGTYNDGRYFFCPALSNSACPNGWTYSLSGFTTSSDGGRSVDKSSDIPGLNVTEYDPGSASYFPGFLVSWGDPSVVAAPNGVFYYTSLAIDPDTGANGVMVAVSNANLWNPNVSCMTTNAAPWANSCWTAALVYGNLTLGALTFEDKNLGAVDWSSSSYHGDLYVTWDHFYATGVSSTYGARCDVSLTCTMVSGDSVPSISGSDPFAAFSTPQVGADGRVYVSWCNYGTFTTYGPVTCRIASSPAGGGSFGAPTDIVSFMGTGTDFPTDTVVNGYATEQFRTSSVPVIATDGSNANNVYFTIAVCTSGFYDAFSSPFLPADNPGNCGSSGIVFASSSNMGASWSTPRIISKDAVNIQPWVTVDSSSGEVAVTYYTSAYDQFNHRIDVVAQLSTDGGATWSTKRITPVSNEPDADPAMYDYTIASGFGGSLVVPQYGDYFQAVIAHGNIYALYTGNYTPEQGTYKASPFLAVTPAVAPHLVLAPTGAGASSGDPVDHASPGASVPFNATGFTPGSSFALTLDWGGITVSLANGTVGSGGIASGSFQVPDIQSQVYSITASDAHGVSATASFGVGQVDLTPLQSSIGQLSGTLTSDFATLQGTIGTGIQNLQSSVSSVNSSVTALTNSVSGPLASLSAQLSTVQSGLAGSISGVSTSVGNIGNTLTITEYLVVIATVLAALAAVFAALAMRKKP